MESRYLSRFAKLAEGQLPLRGNRLLVEVLPKEEIKSKGGLIINSVSSSHKTTTEVNRAKLAIVLVSGNGYFDEDGEDVALDVRPGAIIMVSEMGLKYYSEFPGITEYTGETLALTRDSEIHAAWSSIEAYKAYQQTLLEEVLP
jgi:co-chaperonin GroES (HSP10)